MLLDIRHAKLTLEENKETVLKEAGKYYDDLISTLKARRSKFLGELNEHFQSQVDTIDQYEEEWLRKQELSLKILKLQASSDDLKLVDESSVVEEGR